MKVLSDRFILDQDTLSATERREKERSIKVRCEKHWEDSVPIKVIRDQPQSPDPRLSALDAIRL